jgi:hypothetical protein
MNRFNERMTKFLMGAGGTVNIPIVDGATFTETAGAGTYTGAITLPAGHILHDLIVVGVALWNPATSANMKVGDVADDDGFFTNIDLMATDLLAGEALSFALAGGKAGAYIAGAQANARYSATSRIIRGIITTVGGGGTTGRTRLLAVYSVPALTAAGKV